MVEGAKMMRVKKKDWGKMVEQGEDGRTGCKGGDRVTIVRVEKVRQGWVKMVGQWDT